MKREELLTLFRSRGLAAWQANFAASFLEPDSGTFHLLAAPVGSGKTHVARAIVAELMAEEAKRILVLSPNMMLCEQWTARLREGSLVPVSLLTRRELRELEAQVPIGESPLQQTGIYVISLGLARQDDIANQLSAIEWDLIIVDEAHQLAAPMAATLLDRLSGANVVRRLLLISSTPPPTLESWIRPSPEQPIRLPTPLVITNWYGELKNWDSSVVQRPALRWNIYPYRRSPEEVSYLSLLLRRIEELVNQSHVKSLLTQILTQQLSSSLLAFEQTLLRLSHTFNAADTDSELLDFKQFLADPELGIDSAEAHIRVVDKNSIWIDKQSALAIVDECIHVLDMITVDGKTRAFLSLVRSIMSATPDIPRICLFSMYNETISYLHATLDDTNDIGLSLFTTTGASSFAEREETVKLFLDNGGLLLATDTTLGEEFEMLEIRDVIHYDLPTSPLIFEQRRGGFDRIGRQVPLTMHLLLDESHVIPLESELLKLVTGDKAADKTSAPGNGG